MPLIKLLSYVNFVAAYIHTAPPKLLPCKYKPFLCHPFYITCFKIFTESFFIPYSDGLPVESEYPL